MLVALYRDDASVDRIMDDSIYRTRPMQ
ncbi:MAG: hypothetical protein JWO86_6907, partial [Myxococcaceae bacterium]|nr:hypothetical protein [Myxococcaceae bacterium]